MGVFQQWQPIYAAHNVPTFPVRGDTKRPAVKGYLKVGPQVSERFADKFSAYDAFGFALKRAGITVLDVDTPDERVLADALDRHGQTPLVIRTGSGNWQAYYRNRGEGRRIRPWSGKPIDVLGDGFTIAPPSKGALGWYAFVQGTLDDLDRLPSIKGLAVPSEAPAATPNKPERIAIAKGQRNRELLRFCMTEARSCASLDELLDRAAAFAETALSPVPEPVTAEEIKRTAMSAWGYEESAALEALSGKLAKYLAPQVYNSIFTGTKTLRSRASERSSPSASPISPTSQRPPIKMESEDLTQLLNHYLTEMSKIALQYGATIDKYVGDAIVMFFGDP